MADTLTKNFKFVKPAFNKKPWQQNFYDSLDAIDAVLARYILVSNFVGVWNQATAYQATQRVVDTVGGAIYTCNVNHTSTAINTFAQDRIANPTFWTIFTFSVQFRGTWLAQTDYSTGDFVVFGQRLAVANATHHSSNSFVTDQANGLWNVLIDGTAVVALPTGTAANADQTIRYDGGALQYQLTSSHKVSSAGVTTLPAGSVANPSLNLNAQGGLYSPGAGLLAISLLGTEVWRIKSDGTFTPAFPDLFRQGQGFPAAAAANAGSAIGWDSTGSVLTNLGLISGFANRIINGDMRIDQRHAGNIFTPAATVYGPDRWQLQLSTGSKLTFQQAFTITPGFTNSLKCSVAATYVPLATDVFTERQGIEGLNIADLMWGTASAKSVTVSFWAQSSVAGVYNIALQNAAANRCYGALFTIAAPNVAQFFTIVIPGDTTGSWATDSTVGVWLVFDMGSGSNFTAAPGAWAATTLYSATGALKFVSQANASSFFITGVSFRIGSDVTQSVRAFGEEMMLCNRYYCKTYNLTSVPGAVGDSSGLQRCFSNAANVVVSNVSFPARMRANPTFLTYSYQTGASGVLRDETGGVDVATTISAYEGTALVSASLAAATRQAAYLWSAEAEF